MKVKYKGKIVEAHRWVQNGDHPEDNCKVFNGSDGHDFWGEGHVVRYFRNLIRAEKHGTERCKHCGHQYHLHGWIESDPNKEVCPGDWIVKDGNNYKSYPSGFFSEPDDLDKRR